MFRNEFFRKPPRQHKRRFENRRQSGVAKNRVIRKDASQKPPAAFETFGRASFVHDHERHDVEFVHALRAKGAGRDRYGLARFPNPGTCVCRLSARNYSITWPERLTLFSYNAGTTKSAGCFCGRCATATRRKRPRKSKRNRRQNDSPPTKARLKKESSPGRATFLVPVTPGPRGIEPGTTGTVEMALTAKTSKKRPLKPKAGGTCVI